MGVTHSKCRNLIATIIVDNPLHLISYLLKQNVKTHVRKSYSQKPHSQVESNYFNLFPVLVKVKQVTHRKGSILTP